MFRNRSKLIYIFIFLYFYMFICLYVYMFKFILHLFTLKTPILNCFYIQFKSIFYYKN